MLLWESNEFKVRDSKKRFVGVEKIIMNKLVHSKKKGTNFLGQKCWAKPKILV